jgi:hypothetical protein
MEFSFEVECASRSLDAAHTARVRRRVRSDASIDPQVFHADVGNRHRHWVNSGREKTIPATIAQSQSHLIFLCVQIGIAPIAWFATRKNYKNIVWH